MNYEVKYFFSKTGQAEEENGDFLIDSPSDCLPKINQMRFDEDSLSLYNLESAEKLQISFEENSYLVRDLMADGFYEKTCTYDELVQILEAFSNPSRDPLSYGMESFG